MQPLQPESKASSGCPPIFVAAIYALSAIGQALARDDSPDLPILSPPDPYRIVHHTYYTDCQNKALDRIQVLGVQIRKQNITKQKVCVHGYQRSPGLYLVVLVVGAVVVVVVDAAAAILLLLFC